MFELRQKKVLRLPKQVIVQKSFTAYKLILGTTNLNVIKEAFSKVTNGYSDFITDTVEINGHSTMFLTYYGEVDDALPFDNEHYSCLLEIDGVKHDSDTGEWSPIWNLLELAHREDLVDRDTI